MNTNEPVFGNIPLASIHPSKTNPRKHFDQAKLEDLSNSIKQQGLGQPILVRPLPDTKHTKDCVEIVAGERRYRASKLAGLETIPVIVRQMTDSEVLEFQLVENLQREDVHPIEEAEGYERLMKEHGLTADDCAAKVGKSRSYIYGRLKFCSLAPKARTAFYDGKLSASTALLVARIPVPALQAQATSEIINWNDHEAMPYRTAVAHVQRRYMLDLASAKFSVLDAKLLPSAGACADCPKRTGNDPELFSDVTSADVCIDPDCFTAKRTAHDDKTLATAKKKGVPVIEFENVYQIKSNHPDLTVLDTPACRFSRHVSDYPDDSVEDSLPPELVPEPKSYAKMKNGDIIALYEKTAIQEALEKAGLCLTIEQHTAAMNEKLEDRNDTSTTSEAEIKKRDEQAENERQATLQSAYRLALYKTIRERIASGDISVTEALRAVAGSFLEDGYCIDDDVAELYDIDMQDEEERSQFIEKASLVSLATLLLDSQMGSAVFVTKYHVQQEAENDDAGYQAMLKLAKAGTNPIDAAALRAEMVPEKQPEEKPAPAKKAASKKAPKKADPAPSEVEEKKPATTKKPATKKSDPERIASLAAWPFPTSAEKAEQATAQNEEPKNG